jgi:hypothetical protein
MVQAFDFTGQYAHCFPGPLTRQRWFVNRWAFEARPVSGFQSNICCNVVPRLQH